MYMMDGANKRKAYVKIGAETSSDEIFAILDSIESDNEEDIENLLDDSDTEFVYDKSINRPISEDKNMKKSHSSWLRKPLKSQFKRCFSFRFSMKMEQKWKPSFAMTRAKSCTNLKEKSSRN